MVRSAHREKRLVLAVIDFGDIDRSADREVGLLEKGGGAPGRLL